MKVDNIKNYNNFSYTKKYSEPINFGKKVRLKSNVRKGLIISSALLISYLGVSLYNKCSNTQKDSQGVEYVSDKKLSDSRSQYIDSIPNSNHTVKQGESLYSISKKYNVSISDIEKQNRITGNTIYPNQVLKIPSTLKIKNVKSIEDVAKLTGISKEYLKNLEKTENPDNIRTIYIDKNNNKTIGVGHKLSAEEVSKYQGREVSDEEKYTLLANDILVRESNIKGIIEPDVYDNLPVKLRENVMDFVFHRGETSFKNNKKLIEGLNIKDYTKAVANLYMNYTIVKDKNGNKVERHLAGLCKRSLIRMGEASTIFKNGIPEEVLKSAKKTYNEGLVLLKKEFDNGDYPAGTYENVKAEYMDIAYNLFEGKIGVQSGTKANKKADKTSEVSSIPKVQPVKGKTPVYVNGRKINLTKEQIEADWANTAARYVRPFKRPELCLDANGNVTAFLKELAPTGRGVLNNKVIIVNQGHGGCAANAESPNNTVFDPGASNAVMEPVMGANGKYKRNKRGELILLESNKFVGNGGKALEEWKVNENFSNDLITKLRANGAKVVFISGEVHNAQNAIRNYERNHKVHLFISLHSNSSETIKVGKKRGGKEYIQERVTPRGFFIMPNVRNGEDVEDFALAKSINMKFHEDSWLVGLGDIRGKSLGVLSASSTRTSSVPGVLIETGNLKNPTDVANLNSRDFRARLINATYEGIVDYLKNK